MGFKGHCKGERIRDSKRSARFYLGSYRCSSGILKGLYRAYQGFLKGNKGCSTLDFRGFHWF